MIKFYCPHCSQKLGVPDDYAGRRVRCSKCGRPSGVPAAVSDRFERVEEPAGSMRTGMSSGLHPSSSSAQSCRPLETEAEEGGPDPLALAAARAARDRKYTKALLQSTQTGGSSPHPTFGLDNIPLPARIPLALATSLVLAVLAGLLWAWVASASGWIFGLFCFLSAGAAAWGLTLFTENRNVGLGVLAVILGFGAVLYGKYMVGRWAIMPMLMEHYEEQMAGGDLFFMSPEQMHDFLADDEQMLSVACASLIRDRKMEEPEGRKFIIHQQTQGQEPADLNDARIAQIRLDCTALRDGWDQSQRQEAVLKHAGYVTAVLLTGSRTGNAIAQGIAFANAFSFWDFFLIPMALALAFKTGAGTV